MTSWDDMVLVGTIARPHGIRGQVIVNPETDFVEARFRPGSRLWTRTREGDDTLTVASCRLQGGRPVIGFDGRDSIEAVERLIGCQLRVPETLLQPLAPGQYYHHQLVGCVVETLAGERIGAVVRVTGGAGTSLLEVRGARGEVLVPLADAICVEVDVGARRIRIDPPEGLLALNERPPDGSTPAARD